MGLFSRHKNNEPIHLPEKYKDAIIHPLSNKLSKIRLGEYLNVNDGWSVVIVAKGQPLEIFNSGQHQLSVASMPNTARVLKLNQCKVKKSKNDVKMQAPDNFLCDLYFVNLNIHNDIPWHTGKIGIRSKRYGMYSVRISGSVSVMVTKPLDFLRLFLYQWSHIPIGKDKIYLSSLLDEECQLLLTKSDYTDPNDFLDNPKIVNYLTENLNKTFSKYGVKIENVTITASNISGKVASMLQSEQNGNSGLTEIVSEQIDTLQDTTSESEGTAHEPKDNIQEQEFDEQKISKTIPQAENELVYVAKTNTREAIADVDYNASNTTSPQYKQDISFADFIKSTSANTENNDIKLTDILNKPIQQDDNNNILPVTNYNTNIIENTEKHPKDKVSKRQNNSSKLDKKAKNSKNNGKILKNKQKNIKNDTKNAKNLEENYNKDVNTKMNPKQENAICYLDEGGNEPRTINIAQDVVCPKCGGIMLGGVCINCQHKKEEN